MIIENEMTRSTDVERLLSIREKSINDFKIATGMLYDISLMFKDNGLKNAYLFNNVRDSGLELSHQSDDGLKRFIKTMDNSLWRYMLQKTNMFDVMDYKTKDKFVKELENPPAFTKENIVSVFSELLSDRNKTNMFESGIINLFKTLSWEYKTNQPQKLGGKVILERFYCSRTKTINYGGYCDRMIDLERVMLMLDGKKQPAGNDLLPYICQDSLKKSETYENDYLKMKGFKNGNLHVTFKNMGIIDKMNKVIAKHYPGALPAPK